jgi:hypothetical protein
MLRGLHSCVAPINAAREISDPDLFGLGDGVVFASMILSGGIALELDLCRAPSPRVFSPAFGSLPCGRGRGHGGPSNAA